MKALILAAGMGTRLAPMTNTCPKALIPVNGKPILIKQIENLYENGVVDITIIAGYKAEKLIESIKAIFPNIKIHINCDYSTTNNMYSAYLARDIIGHNEFIMMNADVFFDSSIIKSLLECNFENAVVTDIGRYMEESMKVIEENGYLTKISKEIVQEESLGCSIDVYKFSASGGQVFFDKCVEYVENRKELKKWSEVALNDILLHIKFRACPLVGRWVEIDNLDDLKEAETTFPEI